MSIFRTSSLVASEPSSKHAGIFKKMPVRISKQDIVTQKMFGGKRGSTGKDLKIGKLFKKKNPKDEMKGSTEGDVPHKGAQGLSPDMSQFDKMMEAAIGKKKKNGLSSKMMGNKKMPSISRKMFD